MSTTTGTDAAVVSPTDAHNDLVHRLRAAAPHDVKQPPSPVTGRRPGNALATIAGPGDARATPQLRAAAAAIIGQPIPARPGITPGTTYPPNVAAIRAALKRWATRQPTRNDP